MFKTFVTNWRWNEIPLTGGNGRALLKLLRETPDEDIALILACVFHLRNRIYRDTNFDLLADAKNIKGNDAFIPAGKALWIGRRDSYLPMRQAHSIWTYTVSAHKPEALENLCPVWQQLQRGAASIEKAASIASERLGETVNTDGYSGIPAGVC